MGNAFGGSSWTPCPVTGLAPAEKQSIRLTWALFKKNLRIDGPDIFLVLFLRYPEYQKLFTPFANDDANALKANPRLAAHALAVAYTLTSIIDNLDQPDTAKELIRKVANTHYGHSVKVYHFEHFSIVLIDVLADKLGSHMTVTATDSWGKFMKFLAKCVELVYAEKEGSQAEGSQKDSSSRQEASEQHESEREPSEVKPTVQSVPGTASSEEKIKQPPLVQPSDHVKQPPQRTTEPQPTTQPAGRTQSQHDAKMESQPLSQQHTQPQTEQATLQKQTQPATLPHDQLGVHRDAPAKTPQQLQADQPVPQLEGQLASAPRYQQRVQESHQEAPLQPEAKQPTLQKQDQPALPQQGGHPKSHPETKTETKPEGAQSALQQEIQLAAPPQN